MARRRSRNDQEPSTESLLRLAEKADLEDDPKIQKLIQRVAATDNSHLKRQLEKALAVKASQRSVHPFDSEKQSQPVPTPMRKQVTLGTTKTGGLYLLQEDDLTQHLLTVGQSGAGKTTLFYNLMQQLRVPYWSFDLKQDYRHLLQQQDDLLVLPWSELKFNPVRPPQGVKPRRWAQVFSEIFGHATALLSGSKNYLMKQIIELYKLYSLFDEVSEPYPSLHELQLLIQEDKINYVRTASDYRDRLLNRLEAMNMTAGTIFDCSEGYPIEELLDRDIIFEFDGLSRDLQNFLMEILFAYVYEHRLAQNQRDSGLEHVFFLDEGKRVFSVYKERQEASGIPEIDELTAKMREFGEGLVVADQEASKLTDSIKANTYTKVLLPTGDRKQFSAMTESMNLDRKQVDAAQELGTGEAVVQVGNRDPVPVSLEGFDLEKRVSDDELQREMAGKWSRLSFEEREITPKFDQEMAPGRSEEVEEPEVVDDPSEIELSSDADRLLEDIVEDRFKPVNKRYQLFSSTYKGNEARKELVDYGVVVERRVRQHPGKLRLFQLTEKGREYAENQGLDVEVEGRGGVIHRYWQHKVKEAFEKEGHAVKLEQFDADVYVHFGSFELAIEIAMEDKPREIQHVEKHLSKNFVVWVVGRTDDILEGLKQRLEENGLDTDRVGFRLFRDFNDLENLSMP